MIVEEDFLDPDDLIEQEPEFYSLEADNFEGKECKTCFYYSECSCEECATCYFLINWTSLLPVTKAE